MRPERLIAQWPVSTLTGHNLPIAIISIAVLTMPLGGELMLKKDETEHPIPELWRSTFRLIASAFVSGDFKLRDHPIEHVEPIDDETAQSIADNVADYGEPLAALNDATWDRSVYLWMDGYWQMLVDLSTEAEPVSDLTIHARLYDGDTPRLQITSVYVP